MKYSYTMLQNCDYTFFLCAKVSNEIRHSMKMLPILIKQFFRKQYKPKPSLLRSLFFYVNYGQHVCVQMISVLVDKMIRTQIVDCAAVANWIFSPDMAHDFTRYIFISCSDIYIYFFVLVNSYVALSIGLVRLYVWEILHSTIRKMNKHVQKIQKELEEAKDKLEKQQHKKVQYEQIYVGLPLD